MPGRKLKLLVAFLMLTGIFALLSLATNNNRGILPQSLHVTIADTGGQLLVSEQQIKTNILNAYPQLLEAPLEHGDLRQVEEVVKGISFVNRAHAFRQPDGNIQVNTLLFTPLVRVVNAMNQSFYITHEGRLVPLSPHFTPRVMVATGNIRAGYSPLVDLKANKPPEEITLNERVLRDLFYLATTIYNDTFLRSFFDHIHITSTGQFELTPRNGAHIVELGGVDRLDSKFDKLLRFYRHSLLKTGWEYYSRINIEFNNQVICSK